VKVQLIGMTVFLPPADVPWEPEIDDVLDGRAYAGQQLAEFAGRACYQSWDRPNPKTATNKGYLKNIIDIGHESVLEHGSVTFYIQGVSRSLTHELVRHRHLSFSQLSQRYVDESDTEFVVPPLVEGDKYSGLIFQRATEAASDRYTRLVEQLAKEFPDAKRKEIRQAARAVLPNATETKIVVTGNYRAWRHFVSLRATEAADVEIRALAVEILRQLRGVAPNVVQDFEIFEIEDGTTIAVKDSEES
jgi:thymidylate synthase (FAD)